MSRRIVTRLSDFIRKYGTAWSVLTIFLYLGMIPLTIFFFPATSLLLAVIVLFSGFTSSVAALASALTAAEQAQRES